MRPSCYSSTIQHRNDCIVQSFLKLRASGQFSSLTEIANTIAACPVGIHFISYRSASLAYWYYLDSEYPDGEKNVFRKQLYDSFLANCRKIRDENPNMDMPHIIKLALLSRAPHCGISPQQIRKLLKKLGYK